MTEHCPYPFVNHRWKSSLEIIGREDGDVGRVVVVTLSFIDHQKILAAESRSMTLFRKFLPLTKPF